MDLKDASPAVPFSEATLPSSSVLSAQNPARPWHRVGLGLIALLSAFLSFSMLQLNGYGNGYYAASVRSMLESWHNFFFVSFDPGGFVTVDKPPLGLWIQAASTKLLGFSGFSIILPQALAGIGSVLLLYYLVRRNFGPVAGLLAALFLAITPLNVVMMRDNNLDMQLVLVLLLSTWAIIRATETGKLRWLLLGAVFLGLGFNIKTLEAYLVLPALGLLYLLGVAVPWRKRIWHLAVATLVLLVISFSWITIVDLTPASQRPYVGSSQTNSELELTFGYNGVARLLGGLFTFGNGEGAANISSRTTSSSSAQASTGRSGFPGGLGGGVNPFDNGPIGPTRFFTVALGGQVSWLLPLAIVSLFVLAWQTRFRIPLTRPHRELVLWGMWLLTMGVFFSIAGLFHSYYLVVFSPAVCALSAIGIVLMWREYRERSLRDWRSWSLIVALVLTAAEQIYLLSSYQSLGRTLSLIVGGLCLLAVVALIVARILPASRRNNESIQYAMPVQRTMSLQGWAQLSFLSVGMVALLLTPFIWSYVSTTQTENTALPTAGPTLASNELGGGAAFGGGSFFSGNVNSASNAKLISYLEAHNGNTRYLLAVPNALGASDIIIETGKPVMALGGFLGIDPILTQQKLINLMKNGTVRFFLTSGIPMIQDMTKQQRELLEEFSNMSKAFLGFGPITWITNHCTVVPQSEWSTGQSSGNSGGGFIEGRQLYDCATMH
jgi:4-amino-4-deoxy-L-arabinose transferase-like glycosyltransferase